MDVSQNLTPLRWPFWWLALAWLCANVPAPARLDLAEWLAGLQHFSHQDQLSVQVRAALHSADQIPTAVVAKPSASKPAAPFTAVPDSVKKIELSAGPRGLGIFVPLVQDNRYVVAGQTPPLWCRSEPPLPPPRS